MGSHKTRTVQTQADQISAYKNEKINSDEIIKLNFLYEDADFDENDLIPLSVVRNLLNNIVGSFLLKPWDSTLQYDMYEAVTYLIDGVDYLFVSYSEDNTTTPDLNGTSGTSEFWEKLDYLIDPFVYGTNYLLGDLIVDSPAGNVYRCIVTSTVNTNPAFSSDWEQVGVYGGDWSGIYVYADYFIVTDPDDVDGNGNKMSYKSKVSGNTNNPLPAEGGSSWKLIGTKFARTRTAFDLEPYSGSSIDPTTGEIHLTADDIALVGDKKLIGVTAGGVAYPSNLYQPSTGNVQGLSGLEAESSIILTFI